MRFKQNDTSSAADTTQGLSGAALHLASTAWEAQGCFLGVSGTAVPCKQTVPKMIDWELLKYSNSAVKTSFI